MARISLVCSDRRRRDVVGICPATPSLIGLAGALPSEQGDELVIERRYLSVESVTLVLGA